ncbi:unnamed protein product [Vicia faba]|uniref:Uncharacterized protein n=1 Tax=Vicia faba TaxID=3906 RepID=A0AAV0YYX1_VICFA|nr:unnamed protein product [Vicia faba]
MSQRDKTPYSPQYIFYQCLHPSFHRPKFQTFLLNKPLRAAYFLVSAEASIDRKIVDVKRKLHGNDISETPKEIPMQKKPKAFPVLDLHIFLFLPTVKVKVQNCFPIYGSDEETYDEEVMEEAADNEVRVEEIRGLGRFFVWRRKIKSGTVARRNVLKLRRKCLMTRHGRIEIVDSDTGSRYDCVYSWLRSALYIFSLMMIGKTLKPPYKVVQLQMVLKHVHPINTLSIPTV